MSPPPSPPKHAAWRVVGVLLLALAGLGAAARAPRRERLAAARNDITAVPAVKKRVADDMESVRSAQLTRRRLATASCSYYNNLLDSGGNDCSWYGSNTDKCGSYDDEDFTAAEDCCYCGGGLVPDCSDSDWCPWHYLGDDYCDDSSTSCDLSCYDDESGDCAASDDDDADDDDDDGGGSPTPEPTPSPYEYAPTENAMPYCKLFDASVCWGNTHRYLEVTANGPFDGIDVGVYYNGKPVSVDLDGDGTLRASVDRQQQLFTRFALFAGDLDLVVGEYYGSLN